MLKIIEGFLWAVATALILCAGVYFTYKLKFIQFRFKDMVKNLFKKSDNKNSISPFESLMLVLGGRIGVGSVAGIALALYLGGVGSIFWMWVVGLLAIPISFAETVLGVRYKEKDGNVYKGGPSYYLKNGLKKPWLGNIYAFLIILSFVGGFLGIQSNTIVKSINSITPVSPPLIGIILVILTLIIILGGVKKIASVSSKLVPIMTIIYTLSALIIIVFNLNKIPIIFVNIIKEAFNLKAVGAGFIGNMIIGIQRGIFSSEAGLGTGAIAASTTDSHSAASQGFVQMIGIYITTFLLCTATAIIILTADIGINFNDVNGIEITQMAFVYHLGNIGNLIVFASIIMFCFSTILSGYYDGESSLKYFFGEVKPLYLNVLKGLSLIILFLGSIMSSSSLWSIVDILSALLGIINIYAMFKLKDEVFLEYQDYDKYKHIKIHILE